ITVAEKEPRFRPARVGAAAHDQDGRVGIPVLKFWQGAAQPRAPEERPAVFQDQPYRRQRAGRLTDLANALDGSAHFRILRRESLLDARNELLERSDPRGVVEDRRPECGWRSGHVDLREVERSSPYDVFRFGEVVESQAEFVLEVACFGQVAP